MEEEGRYGEVAISEGRYCLDILQSCCKITVITTIWNWPRYWPSAKKTVKKQNRIETDTYIPGNLIYVKKVSQLNKTELLIKWYQEKFLFMWEKKVGLWLVL